MKFFLVASLVLNLALAGTVLWLKQHPSPAGTGGSPVAAPSPSSRTAPALAEAASAAATVEPQKVVQSFDWHSVESEDYKKYIANLRSIGCPEETIRDIITADVNKLFESRKREMTASTNKFQFWKTGNMFADMMNPERMEKTQALAKEKRALLKELLGVEPEEKVDLFAGMNPFESMLDFLSPAKQNEALEIYQKYQAKMMKGFSGGGQPDADDMKQMQKTQKEMEAELAGIMTPKEFEDYQLRMSQTAMMMRMTLGSFDPNEQEFRDIFKVKKQFDDEYSMFGAFTLDKAEREKRAAAEKEMKDQLKNLLGDTRYAEYERSQDYVYQSAYRVTEKYGLPGESAGKVYDMKRAAEDAANKIRQDKTLSSEQRTAALSGIRAETEKAMQGVLGDKAYKSYQGQAYWLRSISPDPKE